MRSGAMEMVTETGIMQGFVQKWAISLGGVHHTYPASSTALLPSSLFSWTVSGSKATQVGSAVSGDVSDPCDRAQPAASENECQAVWNGEARWVSAATHLSGVGLPASRKLLEQAVPLNAYTLNLRNHCCKTSLKPDARP